LKKIFFYSLGLALLCLGISCDSDIVNSKTKKAKKGAYWKSPNSKDKYAAGTPIDLEIGDYQNKTIDSVVYFVDNNRIGVQLGNVGIQWETKDEKLGKRRVVARLYQNGRMKKMSGKLNLMSGNTPVFYDYSVVNKYPHSTKAYTQGLEFDGDVLYESTGQYGFSSIRKVELTTGEVLKEHKLAPNRFGEGLTIINEQLIQLTWRSVMGYVYNKDSFDYIRSFPYGKSKEGWGICNDGEYLYKSDGSHKIYKLDPNTFEELGFIQITSNKSLFTQINELEWVNGEIWANVYTSDFILRIEPKTGEVLGIIQLGGLLTDREAKDVDYLNGIAYHQETGKIYVTGKNWPSLFEIKLMPR